MTIKTVDIQNREKKSSKIPEKIQVTNKGQPIKITLDF